ncbi:phenylalanine--tRNA ligase, putative [Plasmodium berghei]|uniref:phenylalanine--tRNA ligase n=2 Tax=Plasmodium berghei TaxID=5821 RepID=A0A509AVA9_PLABA|nr:phenylalanine--tRNA ligase, putative [Plasmodium berghei ANKA]CXJ24578.1 phenylalanine--tRNA ligase, putative [Plasmodium berghei]SCM26805.1 phenylalanine--tRNA ligase, putative [Plasmodium berghei]SCN28647.1 phenylalanine--tRNA ligase, putative [Plasmodium berghei]SCO62858.1 phenylalanine--tRNA ligase, putative [Plasmodium berghei]SCO64395.1 phenylalanine--tRNA ligase, putative [Plasmodium berghei]|eukprot:XP_034424291.1 phenylalanine--tRNA ligase, putative [Plasmodium berghei ANKA]
MLLFYVSIVILAFFQKYIIAYRKKPQFINNIIISKLNKDYYIKDDIVNYARFKYVYNIKNHPIHNVTDQILQFLKTKNNFYAVYNKCPLYNSNTCFNDILIKNTNETTSLKNNFYFSDSYLYIPQATSLFPHIHQLINNYQKYSTLNEDKNNDHGEIINLKKLHGGKYQNKINNGNNCINDETGKGGMRKREKITDQYNKLICDNSFNNIATYICKNNECNKTQSIKPNALGNSLFYPNTNNFNSFENNYAIISNVFRKDNIDKLHFSFFNQMDIYIKIKNEAISKEKEMIYFLCELLSYIFGKNSTWRIKVDSFDFTDTSLQAEIFYNNKWVEILGCGILKEKILLKKNKKYDMHDYLAVGLGLDRIAMIKYGINRIRDLYLYTSNTHQNYISNPTEKKQINMHDDVRKKNNLINNMNSCDNCYISHSGKGIHIKNVEKNVIDKLKNISNTNEKTCALFKDSENNILLNCPQREGFELKNKLQILFKTNKMIDKKKQNDEFLYFINLYNIKDEEYDLSFYANCEWNDQLFTKTVLDLKNIQNFNFLKKVILLDVFFNEIYNRTSYTYKFIYSPASDVKDQKIFKDYVKKLHNQIKEKIASMYDISIR